MDLNKDWPPEGARRVPLKVYTDPDNYQKEQDVIFKGKSWNYVGLASEVPEPGDFLRTYVGEVPVIMVRDRSKAINVLVNRCTHRGARVCQKNKGKTKLFVCPYHEWSFSLDGRLTGVPYKKGIDGKGGMSACFKAKEHGLTRLKVAERNGVVFASFSDDIEPLDTYFGNEITYYFDRVCDGHPLEVIGKMSHVVNANWKLQIENVKDPVHAAILHSFFTTFGIWRSDQESHIVVDSGGRNSVLVSTASFKKESSGNKSSEKQGEFDLEDKRLIAHQQEFEEGTGAVMTIWPNLILLQQLNCLVMRHVRPTGPDSCVKTWTFFGYKGESPELRQKRLMQANLLGPSGLVTIDDNEVLAITQQGAHAQPEMPVVLEAGVGTGNADYLVTESAIRGFYAYYQSVMGY